MLQGLQELRESGTFHSATTAAPEAEFQMSSRSGGRELHGQGVGYYLGYNLTFDQRISRDFELRKVRLSVMVDVFNLLNLDKNLREFDLTGRSFAERRPLDLENPRVFRLGVRLSF